MNKMPVGQKFLSHLDLRQCGGGEFLGIWLKHWKKKLGKLGCILDLKLVFLNQNIPQIPKFYSSYSPNLKAGVHNAITEKLEFISGLMEATSGEKKIKHLHLTSLLSVKHHC